MGRLAQLQALRLIKALERLGWVLSRQTGSHAILAKANGPTIVVPVHKGRPLREGTARAILKQAGVSEDALFEVYR